MLKLRVSILIPQTYGKAIFSRGKTDILSKELTKIVIIVYTDLNGNFRNRSGLVRPEVVLLLLFVCKLHIVQSPFRRPFRIFDIASFGK